MRPTQLQWLPARGLADIDQHRGPRSLSRNTQLVEIPHGTICGLHRTDRDQIMLAHLRYEVSWRGLSNSDSAILLRRKRKRQAGKSDVDDVLTANLPLPDRADLKALRLLVADLIRRIARLAERRTRACRAR